ncbi:PREDICTED: little elongation complex subunit 2-like isoform X1 [Wasmannia auropunctata]|uniref:little elongation complex subunit 2-like isoform X1 n=1 Tax=Wasmannia auropunctata TaxID=64793 RepID=UPI0005ED84C6|nr:PREDICTED: little elongation complex subunit 2-like isoform X1 [Wasmannia auropunctata]
MERFRSIDWYPALEDLIDNVFIRDERMERESAMCRILTDTFTDPFENIESEYDDANVELMKKYLLEDGVDLYKKEREEAQKAEEQKDENNSSVLERSYVPGIRRLSTYFPRRSHLDKAEQAMCLRVLLRLADTEKKKLTDEEKKELQQYMALKEKISEEQKEFLEFVKSVWNDSVWHVKCFAFMNSKWKMKRQKMAKLPRNYVESLTIPLSVQDVNFEMKDIIVGFVSCLREGSFSNVVLPKLDCRCRLNMEPDALRDRFPAYLAPDKVTQHFRLPVSEDTYCESLAVETGADFVISSSGLKCLLNNVDPEHSSGSWLVPVVVRSHRGKNIIYVDKKLPSVIATIPQKNTWVYKYILRYYFVGTNDESDEEPSEETKRFRQTKEDKPEKAAYHSDSDNDSNSNDYLKVYEEDLYASNTDAGKSDNLASGKTDSKIDDELGELDDLASGETNLKTNEQQNVSYNLFMIGPVNFEQTIHGVKKYKILVRTKTDGIEMLSNNKSQPLMLAPKLEHQLEYGAEAITLEEGMHQWASLKFRPNTSLARVRIEASTGEIIQIERHTEMSLSNEIKRLYNVKVENSLSILHNIIDGLSSLTPGQYIMQHIPQSGPFAYVYKHTTNDRKTTFDLNSVYCSNKFHTVPKTPWPRIDNMLITPSLRCFQRMPAMFFPILRQKPVYIKPTRGRKKNNQVSASPSRRSDRLKNMKKEKA